MASACRFSAMVTGRSLCIRPNAIIKTLIPKPVPASAFSSPTCPFSALRFASVLGSLETMLPLHSTIAAARLRSNISIDTTCWSWLSQGALRGGVKKGFRDGDFGVKSKAYASEVEVRLRHITEA